jgi:hypothetical protein
MTVTQKIEEIAEQIKEETNNEVDLSIGDIENPSVAVPVLCSRMDRICAMMDYQAELISRAETALEEAKYQYKRKELIAKKVYNEAFCKYKQEDRPKPKDQRRTDKEYEAVASLEADVACNEALTAERVYLNTMHRLDDEKHRYEILNNHFLSYRKACDMLVKELNKLGGPRERMSGML